MSQHKIRRHLSHCRTNGPTMKEDTRSTNKNPGLRAPSPESVSFYYHFSAIKMFNVKDASMERQWVTEGRDPRALYYNSHKLYKRILKSWHWLFGARDISARECSSLGVFIEPIDWALGDRTWVAGPGGSTSHLYWDPSLTEPGKGLSTGERGSWEDRADSVL